MARSGDWVRSRAALVLPAARSALEELVALPSVAGDPDRAADVLASAETTAQLFREAGFEQAEAVVVPGGRPAVIGRRPAPPGRPTVLLYSHHDVQPEGERAGWTRDPYRAVEHGGRLYGRGSADNKAGIAAHLGALRVLGEAADVGIALLIEGEEELGSPELGPFLDTYRDRLQADVIVVNDGINWATGIPSLTTSLRGIVTADVTVRMLAAPVHSGTAGGPVPDAVVAAAHLIASLHRPDGSVAVAGLGGVGAEASAESTERALIEPEEFRERAGALPGVALLASAPITTQLWRRPALAVVGFDAPPIAGSANVLVPAVTFRLSARIAPGQSSASASEALLAHLSAHAPFGAEVSAEVVGRSDAFELDSSGPAFRVALDALAEAWQTEPVTMGGGGGIPAVAALQEAFPDAEIVITAVADPDSAVHGFDESVDLAELERAIVAEALLLDRLGRDS